MKKIYSIVPVFFIAILLSKCDPKENNKFSICDTKDKFVVAKVKIVSTNVFPTEESNGSQVISADLINLLLPSKCDCADEKPLIINSDIYRVDTAAHQKIFNHNDVRIFAGNLAKFAFWQNKAGVIKRTSINETLLQPKQPSNLIQKIGDFILKNSKEDSIFVLANSTKKYQLNGKQYRSFDNVDSVRKNIEQIFQNNPKVNFTVFLNPPVEDAIVVSCNEWTATGNQKCINDVSHVEEKCETGEIRWVKGGKLECSVIKRKSSEKPVRKEAEASLPKPLKTEGVKVEDVKDANIKEMKVPKKYN